MSSEAIRKQSKFNRIIFVPIRVLARARDLYLTSLTGLGGAASYGNAMGCPTPHIPSVPRSFSVNSNPRTAGDELRDLGRLGSARRHNGKADEAELRRSNNAQTLGGGAGPAAVPRSRTVAFGRIDEEKVFECGEEDEVGLLGRAVDYSRTRSYGGRSKRC